VPVESPDLNVPTAGTDACPGLGRNGRDRSVP